MITKTLFVKMLSIILITALLCSACGAQDTGKQPLSATGTAVLTPSGVESELPDDIEDEEIKQKKTTKKDKDGTVWDISKEVKVKQDGYTYHVYLSKDGKKSWIYQADPGSERKTTLSFPEEVQGAVLTKLGRTPVEDDYYDIFGNSVEPYHKHDGWVSDFDKSKINKIYCPATVRNITAAAFCGFRDLKEIILPEKLKKIPLFLLFYCKNLQKIILPQAFFTMLPAIINQFIITLKDTSLISIIGIRELTQNGKILSSNAVAKSMPIWLVVAFYYLVICTVLSQVAKIVERKVSHRAK